MQASSAVEDQLMLAVQNRRWYYVHVDFGPDVQPWLTAIEASSPEDARTQLAESFAADGVTATIGEIGLLSDLPDPDPDDDEDPDEDP
jgi:hypothetical protein